MKRKKVKETTQAFLTNKLGRGEREEEKERGRVKKKKKKKQF